ncbi:MAG: glycosyl hydrolase [Gemmatimonadota bacterium]|nr:glycosyl hydrolase [Gemmatimonadota bacterium]
MTLTPFWTVIMRARRILTALSLLILAAAEHAAAQASWFDESMVSAMKWRNVGPFRGGRSNAVSGVRGAPRTFYFGSTGGGVWKTTDGGENWKNVSDGYFGTGSVGAIAVSESDPNVVYVGMGEHAVRGVMTSHGDGVYRSTDGGKSWTHVGLEGTRQISRIRIHPRYPDVVYVAAQGSPYGATEDRGVYRSMDGGLTWNKVLYVSPDAGASDVALDMNNPRVLYAAFWDHRRYPWMVRSGGEGSGIWRSTDSGDTWTRLDDGLPDLMGKIGIDVSRANPDRVFANIEAADGKGGVYRSDDGGDTWTQTTAERIVQTRSWYYMEVFADPRDENTVYVLNAPMLRSIDAGKTFTRVQVGHGDTHDLWIDPDDPERMILGDDGGGEISYNGGDSWSTLNNQPTAQFYRVSTDNRFPYHIYGGQQDNSALGIASAAVGGIGWEDFYSVSGCESAYLAFDEDDPRWVFGGCYQGLIDVWDRVTEQSKPVMAYPYLGLGTHPVDQKYRFNWNAPIVASPQDPDVIYHGGNVLFRTTDRGQSWVEISPDLTRDDEEKQGAGGGPITNEGAGGENYNTIFYVAPSPHEEEVIWVGTDDGLVQLTRDGGESWIDVTPGNLGEALVNSIEVSPHDPATAYVVITRYKFNDFTPHVFRTTDYGASWRRIVAGIPGEAWVRVVREDPVRPGLLYAGTETGMYVSFDAGVSWAPFQLDLPVVPVTDLTIRNGDLVAATQGRAFWVLDDLSPLRQVSAETTAAPMRLLRPRTTVRAAFDGWGGGRGVAPNPPSGVQLYYSFAADPEGLVTLEILDAMGTVVRTFATNPEEAGNEDFAELPDPVAGMNRFAWDLRAESLPEVEGLMTYGSLQGRTMPPGIYQARLTWGDQEQMVDFEVVPDPRVEATEAQYGEQDRFLAQAYGLVRELYESVNTLRFVKGQVDEIVASVEGQPSADTVIAAGTALAEKITGLEDLLIQSRQKTFQDVINFLNQLDAQMLHLIGSVDGTVPPVTAGARTRLGDLRTEWLERARARDVILSDDLSAFESLLEELGLGHVILPTYVKERRPVT